MNVKLTNLNPSFIGIGGEGISDKDGNPIPRREGVGLVFDCPCCGAGGYVPFANPLDGGPPVSNMTWQRTGDTFDTLTLTPSIRRHSGGGCKGWHGFITNGEAISC